MTTPEHEIAAQHDDVIKWKRCWPFVQGIHQSPVNSPHKGQWRGDLMFSLIGAWTNSWANNVNGGAGIGDAIALIMTSLDWNTKQYNPLNTILLSLLVYTCPTCAYLLPNKPCSISRVIKVIYRGFIIHTHTHTYIYILIYTYDLYT